MSGIYLHIPFCNKACIYCDFHFSTSLAHKDEMVKALAKEISLREDYLESNSIKHIYFGGGTPSLLSSNELDFIFQKIYGQYNVIPDAEVTLEANPDDLGKEKLQELAKSAVNRLSIGIQSFDEEDLKLMNRSHNLQQAKDCVPMARAAGITNISIDLIYGIPGRDLNHWKRQLDEALQLDVPHISAYALTVERETVLENWIRKGRLVAPSEEDMAEQYQWLVSTLNKNGYEQYEVSNFAKKGFRAKHNSSYWSGAHYLGIGPSAHSFDGHSRQWNVSNNYLYLSAINENEVPAEKEILSQADQFNEMIMTSLRRIEGIDLARIDERFGVDFTSFLQKEAQPLLKEGKLREENNQLFIPAEFRFYSDGIASGLFYI